LQAPSALGGNESAAIEATHRVHGVMDVVDDIVVHSPRRGRTDSQIAADVRAYLASAPCVHGDAIRSTVSDGWVTLEGTQRDDVLRDRLIKAIAGLQDVRGVRDEIDVRTPRSSDG
jgi:osmotically-inducible protein OsmY